MIIGLQCNCVFFILLLSLLVLILTVTIRQQGGHLHNVLHFRDTVEYLCFLRNIILTSQSRILLAGRQCGRVETYEDIDERQGESEKYQELLNIILEWRF